MNRIEKMLAAFLIIVAVSAITFVAHTQGKLTDSQAKQFKTDKDSLEQNLRDLEMAQARVNAARSKLDATIFSIMAELKLQPSEWEPVLNQDGTLNFRQKPKPIPTPTTKPN